MVVLCTCTKNEGIRAVAYSKPFGLGFVRGNNYCLLVLDKPNSIAAAATFGFLKVPEIKDPIKSTADQTSVQKVTGMNIAEAAKAGLLAVPTSGEKKGICYPLSDFCNCMVI